MGRRTAGTIGALLIVVAIACGDPYMHTNPYDPAFPVAITIIGPDTLFSQNQYATYTAQTVPISRHGRAMDRRQYVQLQGRGLRNIPVVRSSARAGDCDSYG